MPLFEVWLDQKSVCRLVIVLHTSRDERKSGAERLEIKPIYWQNAVPNVRGIANFFRDVCVVSD